MFASQEAVQTAKIASATQNEACNQRFVKYPGSKVLTIVKILAMGVAEGRVCQVGPY